jgi:putative membrane protein
MESYVYIKALHIIFVVTWFAALFYMPRLLIYHVEANDKQEPAKSILGDQLKIMQKRLWNAIAWPSMVLTWIFGTWLLVLNQKLAAGGLATNFLGQAWFILKLCFVCGLSLYHIQTHLVYKKHQDDAAPWTSYRLRIWNELATIFLFAIVFLVVPKQNTGWVWATLGIILFAGALLAAVALYKLNRDKKANPPAGNEEE